MPQRATISERQQQWRAEIAERLPVLLDRLLTTPDCSAKPPTTHGVYLFSERGTPRYVGRTGRTERSLAKGRGHSNFRARRKGHMTPRHNQGTYAYRLALASFDQAGGIRAATRADNCANPAFMEHFRRACQRVGEMEYRVVEIDDDRLAAVFEVYAATILQTENSWATS